MQQSEGRRRPDVTTVEIIGGPEAVHVDLLPDDERWPDAGAGAATTSGVDVER